MMAPRDFESSTVDSCQYLRFGQTDDLAEICIDGEEGLFIDYKEESFETRESRENA